MRPAGAPKDTFRAWKRAAGGKAHAIRMRMGVDTRPPRPPRIADYRDSSPPISSSADSVASSASPSCAADMKHDSNGEGGK